MPNQLPESCLRRGGKLGGLAQQGHGVVKGVLLVEHPQSAGRGVISRRSSRTTEEQQAREEEIVTKLSRAHSIFKVSEF